MSLEQRPAAATTESMSYETETLAARGRSHTQLRQLLDAREALLHGHERETLLDGADALLFCEPDSQAKRAAPHKRPGRRVGPGRWLSARADGARAALDGCG